MTSIIVKALSLFDFRLSKNLWQIRVRVTNNLTAELNLSTFHFFDRILNNLNQNSDMMKKLITIGVNPI
jgi:hypothetical protein